MRRGYILPNLAAIAVIVLTVSLGNWQMNRAAYKEQLQAVRDAADRSGPQRAGFLPADAGITAGQLVLIRGSFVAPDTVLIDNRTHNGISGVHVVTALRIENPGSDQPGKLIPVLRGWIARDPADRSRLPEPVTPGGVVEVEGRVEGELAKAMELGSDSATGPLWQNFDYARFEQRIGEPVVRLVLRQDALRAAPDDGLVREWPVPGDGVARHHGYAFQWYSLAALVAGLWVWFLLKAGRQRRKEGRG
jgi:surfeit locus 1 family protein